MRDSGIPAAVDSEHGNCPNWLGHPGSMSHAMTDRVTDDARNLGICVTRLFVVCTESLLAMNIRVYVCVYILRDVHAMKYMHHVSTEAGWGSQCSDH